MANAKLAGHSDEDLWAELLAGQRRLARKPEAFSLVTRHAPAQSLHGLSVLRPKRQAAYQQQASLLSQRSCRERASMRMSHYLKGLIFPRRDWHG
jgi:hypothetical protein